MRVQPGDFFLTSNPSGFLRWPIIQLQKLYSIDSEASYSHAGLIIHKKGKTFEALKTIQKNNIKSYRNYNYIIVRNQYMTKERFQEGWEAIKDYEGKYYPAHRLLLFLFPPLARNMHYLDWGVCSELVAKFYYHCGLLPFWSGIMPGDLEDIANYWEGWEIIRKHEGEE